MGLTLLNEAFLEEISARGEAPGSMASRWIMERSVSEPHGPFMESH